MRDTASLPRRCRSVLVAATIGAGAGYLASTANPPPEALQVERLELVESDGSVRAALYLNRAGPRLTFYDEGQRKRLTVGLQVDAPGMEIFTAGGSHALQARHLNGEAVISLHDGQGHQRLAWRVQRDGTVEMPDVAD